MSLRQAKFDDHWRRVYARQFPTRFVKVGIERLRALADVTVEFGAGITAIVGGNGVGKSTLITAIAELLSNNSNVAPGHRGRLIGSNNKGVVFFEQAELHLEATDDAERGRTSVGDEFPGEFRWLDPADLASRCLIQIHHDRNFGDLLEPLAPLNLKDEEVQIVSYLVGKKYSAISIYEVTDYAEFERFPYFKVTAGGVDYRSEEMGRGELSLLLTYWSLRDLKKNSILILEEPETHISPHSQLCLMNIVAKFCDENGLWAIITTHSPTIISRIPLQHIKFIARGTGTAALIKDATRAQIAMILGGGVAYRGVLLVEDEGAKAFAFSLLDELAPDLIPQFELVIAGSDAHIDAALKGLPKVGHWLTIIGVYDGDKREAPKAATVWSRTFLPGKQDPEQLLQATLQDETPVRNALAKELHKTPEVIMAAINHVTGMDHHDFVVELARFLNESSMNVRRALIRYWLQEPSNMTDAEQFVKSLR